MSLWKFAGITHHVFAIDKLAGITHHVFFAQAEKVDKLSNVDETEKTDEKEKRKAELFEKERQERLSKLDEWKVMFKSCYHFGVIGKIETSIYRQLLNKIHINCGSVSLSVSIVVCVFYSRLNENWKE